MFQGETIASARESAFPQSGLALTSKRADIEAMMTYIAAPRQQVLERMQSLF